MINSVILRRSTRVRRLCALAACAAALLALLLPAHAAHAQALDTTDIPTGVSQFGTPITALPNGNFVVVDHDYAEGGVTGIGAVHLYDGDTLERISTLKGTPEKRFVGGPVTVLANGDFVVLSPNYITPTDSGGPPPHPQPHPEQGAVTWGDAETGFGAPVVTLSMANSLVGVTWGDGATGTPHNPRVLEVIPLPSGNYLVRSPRRTGVNQGRGTVTFGNGAGGTVGYLTLTNTLFNTNYVDGGGVSGGVAVLPNGNYVVGAGSPAYTGDYGSVSLTWGSGATGVTGVVSPDNSLMGGGSTLFLAAVLSNGDYVVSSPGWNGGRGAVRWVDGSAPITGTLTAANSLVGGAAGSRVGDPLNGGGVFPLVADDYVVASPAFDNGGLADVGAITWVAGGGPVTGTVTVANSLVGGAAGDRAGSGGVTALVNGHYVVSSPEWRNGAVAQAGAATWADGSGPVTGTVSAANSLTGSKAGDQVSSGGVTRLINGNYVVASPMWDDGAMVNAGAATWGDGATGTVGPVTPANSLVGGTADDQVAWGGRGYSAVAALANGNYTVRSHLWNNAGAPDAGALTWGNGDGGTVGPVSPANSLVGSTTADRVGLWREYVVAPPGLPNGAYVVASPYWDNGAAADAGAVTWGDGDGGTVGPVSPANSLVGTHAADRIGHTGESGYYVSCIQNLADGNYVVPSPQWDNGALEDAGAVTWGSGVGGAAGPVTSANSLVGSYAGNRLGGDSDGCAGIEALPNGDYIVPNSFRDGETLTGYAAVTWARAGGVTTGPVNAANSVTVPNGALSFAFNAAHGYLLVGRPADDVVTKAIYSYGKMILNLITRLEP